MSIPVPTVPAPSTVTPFDPAAAFTGRIPRVRCSLPYRLVMLMGALVMIALPLAYLLMIGALGLGLYRYAAEHFKSAPREQHTVVLQLGSGKTIEVSGNPPSNSRDSDRKLFDAIVVLGGMIVIFFLLKPLLARPAYGIRPRALKPDDEPQVFALVEALCGVVGAPVPRRIQVDCAVNASAGPTRGIFSVLSRDLTLTIGLPLVAGMNLRQLTGVLAHEFGHFSQGGAMLLYVVITKLSRWFARVVYERDAWDVALANLSTRVDIRLAVFFLAIRLCVWLSRRVLWILMHVGFLFNLVLSRQMEYDADRYFARVTGSDGFISAINCLHLLILAWQKTVVNLGQALRERRLSDNLPAMVAWSAGRIPDSVQREFLEHVHAQRTSLLDTHPSPRARIARAEREGAPGVFFDERPATELFHNYAGLCQAVTMDFYALTLGGEVARTQLVSGQEFIGQQQSTEASFESGVGFFKDCLDVDRPLLIDLADLEAPQNPKEVALELKRARERFVPMLPQAREAYKQFQESWTMEMTAYVAREALEAKLPFRVREPRIRNLVEAGRLAQRAWAMREEAEVIIAACEEAQRARIVAALRLLRTPQLAQRIPESREMLAQAECIVLALNAYRAALGVTLELRRAHAMLEFIFSNLKNGGTRHPKVVDKAQAAARMLARQAGRLREMLSYARYPFPHGNHEASLGQYLMELPLDPKDVSDTLEGGSELISRFHHFFMRSMAELSKTTERVEQALGLPKVE